MDSKNNWDKYNSEGAIGSGAVLGDRASRQYYALVKTGLLSVESYLMANTRPPKPVFTKT
jgi:hypothetical protein